MPRIDGWLQRFADLFARPEERERRSLMRVPSVAVADARDGTLVRVVGRVVTTVDGATIAPFTGTPSVWFHARYDVLHRNDDVNDLVAATSVFRRDHKAAEWVTELSADEGRRFWIDDGSAVLAEVDASTANVIARLRRVSDTRFLDADPPVFREFMRAHGQRTTLFMGSDLEKGFFESRLVEGDTAVVAGIAKRTAGAPQLVGYRSTSSVYVVLTDAVVTSA